MKSIGRYLGRGCHMHNMYGLMMFVLLIIILMIYGMGHWHWKECRRRRAVEADAVRDRQEIRKVAESAASNAASCAAVIDKLGTPQPKRRHMRAVRDEQSGVSTWSWGE